MARFTFNTDPMNINGNWYQAETVLTEAHIDGLHDSEIRIPEHTQAIGYRAFKDYTTTLVSVDFSHCTALTYIGKWAFSNCSSLTTVDFSHCTAFSPTNTDISQLAFLNCFALNTMFLPINLPTELCRMGTFVFAYYGYETRRHDKKYTNVQRFIVVQNESEAIRIRAGLGLALLSPPQSLDATSILMMLSNAVITYQFWLYKNQPGLYETRDPGNISSIMSQRQLTGRTFPHSPLDAKLWHDPTLPLQPAHSSWPDTAPSVPPEAASSTDTTSAPAWRATPWPTSGDEGFNYVPKKY